MPELWRGRRAGVIHPDIAEDSDGNSTDDSIRLVRRYLAREGYGSAVYSPIGAGDQVLGALVLVHAGDAQPWSDDELEVVFDIGRDLGRILTNISTFEREQRLAEKLHRLDTFKSDLISTVSHELKNPLTSILGNLELVADQQLPPERADRALKALVRGVHRMADIVDELGALYDVDADRPAAGGVVDLVPIARGACDLVADTVERRHLTLRLALPDSPALIEGEARELDRVVVNLVSNAVKYTPDGGTVGVVVVAHDGEVEVRVEDDGIGISPDDQSHLFDEFFRSPDPAASARPGSGLGLSIADRIVRRHGGRIDVESAVGEGSTFTVHLPAARTPAADSTGDNTGTRGAR
jgi:signal transduction histidine kinase